MKNIYLIFTVIAISFFFTACEKDKILTPKSTMTDKSIAKNKIVFYTEKKIDSTYIYNLYVNEVLVGSLKTVILNPNQAIPDCQTKNTLYVYSSEAVEEYHIKVERNKSSDTQPAPMTFVDVTLGDGGSNGNTFGEIMEKHIKGDAYSLLDEVVDCANGEKYNVIYIGW